MISPARTSILSKRFTNDAAAAACVRISLTTTQALLQPEATKGLDRLTRPSLRGLLILKRAALQTVTRKESYASKNRVSSSGLSFVSLSSLVVDVHSSMLLDLFCDHPPCSFRLNELE